MAVQRDLSQLSAFTIHTDLMEVGHGDVLLINTGISQPWLLFLNVFINIYYKHYDNLP